MTYNIVAEGHEGVASCPDQCLGEIEASTPEEALAAYAAKDPRVQWLACWKRWSLGPVRKVTAIPKTCVQCKNCKFWDTTSEGWPPPEGQGVCQGVGPGKLAEVFAEYRFYTKPDFGCLLGESKR